MSSLEQSLDAIIAQTSKPGRKSIRTAKGSKRPQVQSKSAISRPRNGLRRAPARTARTVRPTGPRNQRVAAPAPINKKSLETASLDVATKVVVSNLPREIDQKSIRDFFKTVGPLTSLQLAYNEKGKSTGVATIIFKTSKAAHTAVQNFNGAPLDGGKSKLKLELVVDTTKVPLAARIQPNVVSKAGPQQPGRGQALRRRLQATKGRPGRTINRPSKIVNKKNVNNGPKKQVKKKKTIEELDQEMADYFATNDK